MGASRNTRGRPVKKGHTGIQTKRMAAERAARIADSERARKRSQLVTYGVVGAVSAACVAVPILVYVTEPRACVDVGTQRVMADDECRATGGHAGIARWYYGGHHGGIGTVVSGGSYERGGFGRLFSGRG
jgi:hypothetical protein